MANGRTRTRLTPLGKVVIGLIAAALVIGVVRLVSGSGGQLTPARTAGSPSSPDPGRPPLPACRYGDAVTHRAGYGDWQRTLLDTELRLPRPYRPPDLVPVSEAGFAADVRVRAVVITDLRALREAAAQAGRPVDVIAAYRSYAEQAELFDRRQVQFGYDRSLDKTARAGHSEHQLGTVVDFKTLGEADVTQSWGQEPTGRWMAENAYRYGFVLSYPEGRRSATCYPYEPWHFRYLGRDLAARFHSSRLTLREFLWNLNHS